MRQMFVRQFKDTEFYKKHKYRLRRANDLLSFFSALCLIMFLAGDQSKMALKRTALSSEIQLTAIVTGVHSGVFEIDHTVVRAMAQVPRHHYIKYPYNHFAYYNVALPVDGHDYMMAEPFVTAMMVHLMELDKNDSVLEIGFGAGYDAAVIAKLAGTVHSLRLTDGPEEETPVAIRSGNVTVHENGNALGLPEHGPYDAILVRQSMTEPPVALLRQLKPGGRLVIPIGPDNDLQRLMVYTRKPGGISKRATLYMITWPLIRGEEI